MQDPYSVLGVSPDADALAVRRAFQKLARRWHPALRAGDPEAEARFRTAARAYALLSDPEQRRRWDEGRGTRVMTRHSVRARRGASLSTPELAYRFEELVVELLPEETAPESAAGAPALDIHSEVELDFAEAIRGIVVSLSVQREVLCEACGGGATDCVECDGRGFGVGVERVRVRIPPGVEDGDRVRGRGQGSVGAGERGDLYVTVRVRPHPHFKRQGRDISSQIPITVREAALGAALEVPTIHGPVTVQLPTGTMSGQRFRLAGKGVRRPGREPGDHYYRVQIVPPNPEERDNRRLLEQLEQADPRRELRDLSLD